MPAGTIDRCFYNEYFSLDVAVARRSVRADWPPLLPLSSGELTSHNVMGGGTTPAETRQSSHAADCDHRKLTRPSGEYS